MADTASSTDRSADPSGGHPFPQLRRSHWCSLDGPWSFAYDDDETGLERDWPSCGVNERTIAVPFPPEPSSAPPGRYAPPRPRSSTKSRPRSPPSGPGRTDARCPSE